MKTGTAKKISPLLRFTIGLALAVSVTGFCTQAIAADEPGQTAEAANTGGTAQKEKGKLSLTKVDPGLTPVSDYSGNLLERSTLTGDWWGSRKNLYDHGVMFDASLTQVFQVVSSGGGDSGDTFYTGLFDYGLNLDTGKLGLWPAGLFTFNAQSSFADDIPLESGNVSPTNFTTIYPTFDKPDTQLMEYYLTQAFSETLGMVIGRVNAVNFLDRNRFANDPRNQFMNLSLNNDPLFGAFISFSTYAAMVSWKITDNLKISPAIFDPTTKPNNYFNDLFDDVGYGVEADLTWTLSKDRGGAFRAIGLYVDKEVTAFDNPRLVPAGRFRVGPFTEIVALRPQLDTEDDNWIIALNAEQYLWKPPFSAGEKSKVRTASFDFQEPGIGLFGRFSFTPEDRNAWNMYASGGIGGRGIIPGRPYDRVGLGIYWMKESDDLDDLPVGNLVQDELGFEAFYNLALTPWAQLSFDVQWIDPGLEESDDTVVLGTRLFTSF